MLHGLSCGEALGVEQIEWIISHVSVEIGPSVISSRITLQEAAQRRRVGACSIVVDSTGFEIDPLPGEPERGRGRGAGTVGPVGEFRQRARAGIHRPDEGAQQVRHRRRAAVGRNIHLAEHGVGAEAVGVPAQQGAGAAVVFEDFPVVGVGDRDGGGAVDGAGLAPALGVEGVACRVAGAGGGDEAVLGVVAEGKSAVGGEVAVGVVGGGDGADGGVLVQAVGGVADGAGRCGRVVDPAVVADRLAGALVGLVVAVEEQDRRRGAGGGGGGDRIETRGGGAVEGVVGEAGAVGDGAAGQLDSRAGRSRHAAAGTMPAKKKQT